MAAEYSFFVTEFILCRLMGKAGTPDPTLLPASRFIHAHSVGKLGLEDCDRAEFLPAHPHVLFPIQLVPQRF